MEAPRPPPAPVSPPSWRQRTDRPSHSAALLPVQPTMHSPPETWRSNGQQHHPDFARDSTGMGGIKYEKDQIDRAQANGTSSLPVQSTIYSSSGTWKSTGQQHPDLVAHSTSMGGVKYEKDQADKAQMNGIPSNSMGTPAPPLSSAAGYYPGPPPPYTSSAPKVSSFGSQMQYASSPADSRRDSAEDRPPEHFPRPALPSISEALARLPSTGPGPHQQPAAQSPNPSAGPHHTSNPHPHLNHSPKHHHRVDSRTGPEPSRYGPSSASDVYHPGPPPRSYSPAHRHNSTDSSVAARQLTGSGDGRSPAPYQHRTSLSSQTTSPVEAPGAQYMSPGTRPSYPPAARPPYYTSALPSPQQASNPPLSARSTNGSFPPAHTSSVQPSYAQPSTQPPVPQQATPQPPQVYSFPPPATSGLTYEQWLRNASSAQQQQQQQQQPRSWAPNPDFEKVEQQRRAAAVSHAEHGQGSNYAVTVKRHLDDFDVENNLNDLAERTGKILDFSRQYGVKAHQHPRSSLSVSDLPKLEDCDKMIDEAVSLRTALERLRRVVEQQNRIAEQTVAQQGTLRNPGVLGQPYGSEADAASRGQEKGTGKNEAATGGFAGGDSKKRKGRNAPPGRCHSCNRVETPEWRRGPDGARTLCNACGLHYAKLTRKLGKENKATNDSPTET